MPRVKDAQDWMLTYSPEGDIKSLPDFFKTFFESADVCRAYCIAEHADKWHLHAGFTTRRTYNSDYKWWTKLFKEAGFAEPALDIKYHDNLFGLIGGYCAKEETSITLFRKGFSDEQLLAGADIYDRGLRRQRVRRFLDKQRTLHPAHFEAAVGAMQDELDCNESTAICALAQDGWSFATSRKGLTPLYRAEYANSRLLQVSNVEQVLPE